MLPPEEIFGFNIYNNYYVAHSWLQKVVEPVQDHVAEGCMILNSSPACDDVKWAGKHDLSRTV